MYRARHMARIILIIMPCFRKSEQEQAQRHEHEQEEPYLMQGPLHLHMPPSLPGVHQMIRARVRVVHARRLRLRLPTEHHREDGHRHAPEHPSGRRVHHAAVPERRGEEGVVEPRGVGVDVGGVPRGRPGWRVGLGVPMVVLAAAVAAVLRALSPGRPARDAGQRLLGAGAPAAAVERHERVRGHGGLAHGALPPRRARGLGFRVGAQPLVDAGPAVEVAAERDHRLRRALEADVAVEAAKARLRRRRRRGRVCADDPLRRFLAGSPPGVLTGTAGARLLHVRVPD